MGEVEVTELFWESEGEEPRLKVGPSSHEGTARRVW